MMCKIIIASSLLLASLTQAATNIKLAPGSSVEVNAGEKIFVTCSGEASSASSKCYCDIQGWTARLFYTLPSGEKKELGSWYNSDTTKGLITCANALKGEFGSLCN